MCVDDKGCVCMMATVHCSLFHRSLHTDCAGLDLLA